MKITKQIAVKLFAVAILCAPLARVKAQQPGTGGPQTGPAGQSLKGADLRGKVPVNRDVLKVTLPRPQEAALKNGLRVLLIENHNVPTFNMQLVFRGGGFNDPADKRGRAGMVAALLREGTKTRSSREISEAVDSLGSTLGATSGIASMITTVSSSGLVDNLDRTLDLFADVVRNPKFAPEEVEKYKSRLLAQLQFQRSVPGFLAQSQFSRAVYGEHPAGQISPQEAAIKSITPDDLAQFHSTYYHPNNAFLAVFGDVTMKELLPKLERVFGDWPKGNAPAAPSLPAVQSQTKPRVFLIDRPGSVQTTLMLGNLGIERTNADYFPLLVMNQILGGGPAARLFMNLREDKGYT
ncbi:MAG: insulinase family protein, partial [Acidobacteriota bacterium]|nr:insulinase family protein [Acidobacteriota bacterium]